MFPKHMNILLSHDKASALITLEQGGCCQLHLQSWLAVSQHMPALSIITPLLQTTSMETGKVSEMGEHKTGPPQRMFDGASQLGFPNSLSLCSLRATWARVLSLA